MAPSVYHRLRWEAGGKSEVVRAGHWMFLAGTASLALGILAAVLLVTDVLFGAVAAVAAVLMLGTGIALIWYFVPLTRGRSLRARSEE